MGTFKIPRKISPYHNTLPPSESSEESESSSDSEEQNEQNLSTKRKVTLVCQLITAGVFASYAAGAGTTNIYGDGSRHYPFSLEAAAVSLSTLVSALMVYYEADEKLKKISKKTLSKCCGMLVEVNIEHDNRRTEGLPVSIPLDDIP
jgi:hypothetical protein